MLVAPWFDEWFAPGQVWKIAPIVAVLVMAFISGGPRGEIQIRILGEALTLKFHDLADLPKRAVQDARMLFGEKDLKDDLKVNARPEGG
jgi:hypothetical protein